MANYKQWERMNLFRFELLLKLLEFLKIKEQLMTINKMKVGLILVNTLIRDKQNQKVSTIDNLEVVFLVNYLD